MLCFEPHLGLARNEDLVEAFGFGAGANPLDQRIHTGAIVGLGDEQIWLERQEEMADVLRAVIGLVLVMLMDIFGGVISGANYGGDVGEERPEPL